MLSHAVKTYQDISQQTMSGRETEARVLTQAALKLVECQKQWDAPDRNQRLDDALRYNQRIWSILQVEVAKPDNPLPQQLRHDLLQLSLYIDNRILDTMAFPEPDKLDMIININRNIAAGLRGSSADPVD